MVLRRFATALCALAFASTAEAQRGQGGFTGFNGAGFATARGSDGPRPLLFGFAVECSRCTSVGRRGQGGGRGPAAVWQYEENPRIAVVVTGSAAERAGIRVGDHLVAVDGKSITTDEGSRRFSELRAGDSTRLTLERAGKTLDVS